MGYGKLFQTMKDVTPFCFNTVQLFHKYISFQLLLCDFKTRKFLNELIIKSVYKAASFE